MGTRYVNISIEEMRSFLLSKGGNLTETVVNDEIAFDFPIKRYPHITIRIFTGIAKSTGASRGCGQDALRVCAINFADKNRPVGWIKSQTAYRTKNWQFNLRDRTKSVIQEAVERIEKPFRLQGEKVVTNNFSNNKTNNFSNNKRNNPLNLSPSDLRAEMEVLRMESMYS